MNNQNNGGKKMSIEFTRVLFLADGVVITAKIEKESKNNTLFYVKKNKKEVKK